MKLDKEASKKAGVKVYRTGEKKVEKVEKTEKKKKSRDIFDEPKEETTESEPIAFRDEE
jgi:predicted nucleotidyltransferase component of viral defense system